MGPRMSIATELHQIFGKYVEEMRVMRDKRKRDHDHKYGEEYTYRPTEMVFYNECLHSLLIYLQTADEDVLNLEGSDGVERDAIFKRCVDYVTSSSTSNFATKILYLDCNNLYGSAQSLPMPLDRYAWGSDLVISDLNRFFNQRSKDFARGGKSTSWDSHFGSVNSEVGFFIECDISFTDKCKSRLRDFPPAPTHKTLQFNELSDFAQKSYGDERDYTPSSKLVASFEPKSNYVVHSMLADVYSSMGVTITNIKKVSTSRNITLL